MNRSGALLLPALICGCTCGRKQPAPSSHPPATATAPGSAAPPAKAGAVTETAAFSAPIAAARLGRLDAVAGLVVAEGVVRVIAFADGTTAWSRDVLGDVKWAPDASLRAMAAGDGLAIVWWGLRQGRPSRTLVQIGAQGEARGPATEIGAAFCGTADGLAWIDPRSSGATGVHARRWAASDAHRVLAVPRDRDPSLVCGDHVVAVLAEGPDDLTVTTFKPGDVAAQPPTLVLRDADFADEEREREAYSVGDDLDLVRVGVSGAVAVRAVPHGGGPRPWRPLKHVLSDEDEIVAVDGDATATFIVTTREVEGACAGTTGSAPQRVSVLRVGSDGGDESVIDLAPSDCQHGPGPFWIEASSAAGPIIAWVERRTTAPSKAAAIDGMSFRALASEGMRAGRIEQAADAIVNGGCADGRCVAAALVRLPDSDGMRPAPIRLFGYP